MQLLRDHHPKKEPPTALQAELDDWTLQYRLSVSILIVLLALSTFSGMVVLLLAPHQSDADINMWPVFIMFVITALFSSLWWRIWLRPAYGRMCRAKEAVENQGRIMVVNAPNKRERENEAAIAAFREELKEWNGVS